MKSRRTGWIAVLAVVLSACTTPSPPAAESPLTTASGGSVTNLSDRAAHTATELADGTVLVAGGCAVDGCTTATTSAAVLSGAGPRPAAGMTIARDSHTATRLISGMVLVAGGFAGEGAPPLSSAELFDPSTNSWVLTGSMKQRRGGHAAARLGDGRVVVVGGWVESHRYTSSTEIYDPAAGQFKSGPDLPAAVDGNAAVTLADGSVLATGGQVSPGRATNSAVVIAPDGSSLQVVGPMGQARFKHTMAVLPSGQVLVIGGTSNDEDLLATTEIYNPTTQRFRPGPTMSSGRYKLSGAAAVLPDGRVVVAGGGPGIELIDVAGGVSRSVSDPGSPRASFSTVTVIDGAVRVIGGYDQDIQLTHTDLTIPVSQLE